MDRGKWTWQYQEVIQHFIEYYEDFLGAAATITEVIKDEVIHMRSVLDLIANCHDQALQQSGCQEASISIPNHKSPGQMAKMASLRAIWGVQGRRYAMPFLSFSNTDSCSPSGARIGFP